MKLECKHEGGGGGGKLRVFGMYYMKHITIKIWNILLKICNSEYKTRVYCNMEHKTLNIEL